MYNRTSNIMEVNDARKQLFTHKSTALCNIPQRRLDSSSTSSEHVCRPIAGTRLWCWILTNLARPTGAGPRNPLGGSLLDNPAGGIKILSRTDPLQLQEGMYWPLQVHQDCTQVHCIIYKFGRL